VMAAAMTNNEVRKKVVFMSSPEIVEQT
jgi:hypothetical protein